VLSIFPKLEVLDANNITEQERRSEITSQAPKFENHLTTSPLRVTTKIYQTLTIYLFNLKLNAERSNELCKVKRRFVNRYYNDRKC